MTRKVHVIAAFNVEGDVQPLWLRLSLEPDAPCYRVVRSVCTKKPDRYRDYAAYRCTVSSGGQQHEIGLNYYSQHGYWAMTVSNSSSILGGSGNI